MNPPNGLPANLRRLTIAASLFLAAFIGLPLLLLLTRPIPRANTPSPISNAQPVMSLSRAEPRGAAEPSPTPDPTPTALAIPPTGRAELPIPPDTSPTVENPTLHLIITIADEDTRRPVVADVTIDGSTRRALTHVEAIVSATEPHTVTVAAEGYLPWSVRIELNLHHHKQMELPVLLRPAQDTG